MAISDAKSCDARTRVGGRCRQPGMRPSGRCRMHGGKAVRGIANKNTVTGRYSTDLPTRLLGRYEGLMADGTLLSLRDDIALIGANIGEELEAIKAVEEEPDMEAVVGKIQTIADNWSKWDWTKMNEEMDALLDIAKGRQNRQDAMGRVRNLIKDKAALIQQENRMLLERDAMIPVDQVMLLMRALVGVVRRTVRDPQMLMTIEGEFSRVVGAEPKTD